MKNKKIVNARPQDNVAILQIDDKNNVYSFVTLGGIGIQDGFQYLEVPRDLVDNLDMRGVPNGYFKYINGKVFLPRFRKLKLQYRKYEYDVKHWYKQSKICDSVDIVGNLIFPHILVSTISALISAVIALYVVSVVSETKSLISFSNFITAFIPCLTIFVTLIGIYVTLRETRLGNERQRKASVKPHISLVNHGTPTGVSSHTRIVSIPKFNDKTIYSHFERSTVMVENVGLAVARNVFFLYMSQNKETMSYGFSIKSLKPDSSIDIEVTIPTNYEDRQILLYSICENIYGDLVFHAHHFFAKVNGENVYHSRDRQIQENSSEYKLLIKHLGLLF